MGMMEKMMGLMAGRMSGEEKEKIMSGMMDRFFADMTADDKKKMMAEVMPRMMEGVNMMEMMPQMMMSMMGGGESGSGKEMGMPVMPRMMVEMMPRCLKVMLPNVDKEKRVDFVLEMVTTLIEEGSAGMSEEEKENFVARVIERVMA